MIHDFYYTFPSSKTDQEFIDSFEWYLEQDPELKRNILDSLELNPFNFNQDYRLEQEYGSYIEFCAKNRIQPVTHLRFYTHIAYLLDEKFLRGKENAKNLNA